MQLLRQLRVLKYKHQSDLSLHLHTMETKKFEFFFSPEEIKIILIMEHLYKDDIDYRTLITYGGNSFEFVV